ncbi:MAG: hypothetical protein JWN70_3796 [Planctomycetaceae bacterium]|nr:hypothetical protein [Planctomycetaceae bacterium]
MLLPAVNSTLPAVHCSSARATLDSVRIVEFSLEWMREWAALEDRLQSPYLTCSYDWTQIWLKHYGDLVPHRLAVATYVDEIVGMCLITNGVRQYEGPFEIKTLHIGTAGEPESDSVCVEYNHLLCAPEFLPQFVQKLAQLIAKCEVCECLLVEGMAAGESYEFLDGETPTSVEEVPSYYCDLNLFRSAPAEPWRLFGESTRNNLRRSLRDLGDLELDWADEPELALAFYEEMVGYHQARWKAAGRPGVFSSDRFRDFHRDLIASLVPQQRAVLVRARQGSRVLGILYLLIEQNRLWYYQGGLPEYRSKHSLGNVTQYLSMLEGARRGYDAFDFLAGDAQYKRVLSTHHNVVYWIRWRRPSLKFRLLDGLRSLRRKYSS